MIRGHVSNGVSRVTLQLDDAGIAELREKLDALQLGRYDQVELSESCYWGANPNTVNLGR